MSITSESSSYDQAISLISDMPFADKLRLNVDLASLLKKEGKSGVVGKAAKKEKKAKDPNAPKKAASLGTQAWFAFVKHCKNIYPERFAECTKEPERLSVCAALREEFKDNYNEFCVDFKAFHSKDSTPSSPVAPVAPVAAPVLTAKEKLKKLNAAKAAAATATAPAAAPAAAAAKAEKPKKVTPAKKEAKKVTPAKKEAKKAEPAPVAEEAAMPKKEIDGVEYWFDPETNGLYSVLDGGFGAWVGFFQPENDDEPIRRTESPSDE